MLLVFLYSSMNECFLRNYRKQNKKKVHTFMTKKPAHKKKYTTTSRSRHIKNNKKNNKKSKLSSLEKIFNVRLFQ